MHFKQIKILLLFLSLSYGKLYAQEIESIIIKTRPLRDIAPRNFNLGLDFNLKLFSLCAEYSNKNRVWITSDSQRAVGYTQSNGSRFLGELRRYQHKREIGSNNKYFAFSAEYQQYTVPKIQSFNTRDVYRYSYREKQRSVELLLKRGRNFIIFDALSLDLNFGVGYKFNTIRKDVIQVGNINFLPPEAVTIANRVTASISVTSGFYFPKKKKKSVN